MKQFRPAMFAAALLALATATSYADDRNDKKGVDCDTIARITLVAPFNLAETSRVDLSDCVSRSTYSGTGKIELATCGVDYPNGVPQQNARVELSTTTTLNECGDGFTNGRFTLTILDANNKATDTLEGTVIAVNRNFGELQGILEGARRYKLQAKGGHYSLNLRASFTAAFIDPDNNGTYDTVSVTDAHGVTYIPNKDASGRDGDKDDNDDGNEDNG